MADAKTQVVNTSAQAANQTSQAASEAASTGIFQDPYFLGVTGAGLLVILFALILKRYSSKLKDQFKNNYQGRTLEDRLDEKQVKPTLEFGMGSKTSKKVDYGLENLGRLERYYKTTEVTEDEILSDIHSQDPEDLDEIHGFEDREVLSSEQDQFKNYTMIVGPTGLMSRFKMRLRTGNPIKNPYLSVYSVPKTSISAQDRIIIDDEKVDWNYSGGIYYSKDVQGITTMYNYAALSLIDDATQVFANKGQLTQALNEKFAEWKEKKQVENQAFIDYMKEKEGVDADSATD